MKISIVLFEKAYAEGVQLNYTDDMQEEFREWFDDKFLNNRFLEYDNVNELVFDELSMSDKQRVRILIQQYSE